MKVQVDRGTTCKNKQLVKKEKCLIKFENLFTLTKTIKKI